MPHDIDSLEDRITLLRHQLKEMKAEVKELREIMNGLAHVVALLNKPNKDKQWVQEYYRRWENKHKDWWNV
jgi:DnaJ-domain-containing protein 1